jgi:hypothetical protein
MKKYNGLLYLLAALKFILPFFLQSSIYEPHRDEFLYLIEAQHMSWGFMEVPPMLSAMAWLTHFFGSGIFWVKFWPCLLGALTYLLAGKIVISLGGKRFAIFTLFLCFIFSGYLRVHFLFQPNPPEIFFYTLIAFGVIKFIQSNQNKWLYVTGIACGLGMMSKYSVLFFIVAVVIGLLLTSQRKILSNKHFYLAALVGFIIFLPNVIWQATHHFPVAYHMNELQQTQLQYVSPVTFLLNQLLMFAPVFFIWIIGLWFIAFNKNGRPYRFLAWAYVIVIAMLLYFHGKDYYALGLYPPLLAFGSYQLEVFTAVRFKVLRYVTTAFSILFGVWLIPVILPVTSPDKLASLYKKTGADKTGALRWEDQQNHALPQDFADMLGWKEMTEKTANVYNSLSQDEKNKTIIKCDNYGLCAALNFYGKQFGLPEVYSYNASFLLWFPDTLNVTNVITVGEDLPDTSRDIVKCFENISVKDSLNNSLARENGSKIILWYHCKGDLLSRFLEKEVAEKKRFLIQ